VLIAGVDEAGRGCIIGPLVIAGVLFEEETLPILTKLGVKDSKLLSSQKRQALFTKIIKHAKKHAIIKLTPAEIDKAVQSRRKLHKLNRLEAHTMAKVIEALRPEVVYVDAADVIETRFGTHIQENVPFKVRIVSEHNADKKYLVVSAASIIAKVERDKEIANLSRNYGEFGSGYLTDPKTIKFLRNWLKTNCEYPDCVRKSWKTAKKVKNERGTIQKKLF